jgi:hypothetical protein
MRRLARLLLLLVAIPAPEIRYFRFQRAVENVAQNSGQTCIALEPGVFAHAGPLLSDLRLYHDGSETPYVIHMATPPPVHEQRIAPLNLGESRGQTVFDAAMPQGSYRDVELAIAAHDFIATVTVSGRQTQTATAATRLGSYTIFDLSQQRLGRSTVLHLPESDFRFLSFRIAGPLRPDTVTGLSVGRIPASRRKYVVVAHSSHVTKRGRTSEIDFDVPAHTPVDRVVFVPGKEPANFSRTVRIIVQPIPAKADAKTEPVPAPLASFAGNILRVHRIEDGHRIDEERLSVDALSTGLDLPSKWTVVIENGDDAPIDVSAVRLEMIERDLCFDAVSGKFTLYYGDPALVSPQYDYATLFRLQANATAATLGPEQINPEYEPRPDDRPFTERHPALLWVALAVVILLLAGIALRSVKLAAPKPS